MALMVASIDFGTTFSGWAYLLRHDFEVNPTKAFAKNWQNSEHLSFKTSTCVLLKPDGVTFHSFGNEAEKKYLALAEDGEHTSWYFFRRFKMTLYGKKIQRNMEIEDATGKKIKALIVFTHCIRYLKKDLVDAVNKTKYNDIDNRDIHWVLTVPAIWDDASKQFMREAAKEAGIDNLENGDNNLTVALEPEAASLYCRHLPVEEQKEMCGTSLASFKAGDKYLVVDAGGGTVDISAHEILITDEIRELHKASGGPWGGTVVDQAFIKFMDNISGASVMEILKRDSMEDYIDLTNEFERKKRNFTDQDKVTLNLPSQVQEIVLKETGLAMSETISKSKFSSSTELKKSQNKLRIDKRIMKGFFDEPVKEITRHVQMLLQQQALRGCKAIVMVGGLSEASVLQDAMKRNFKHLKVIIPREAGLAVLKGAAIFGYNPIAITERVCKYTYGVATGHEVSPECKHRVGRREPNKSGKMRCLDLFSIHAKAGQVVRLREEQPTQSYSPVEDDQVGVSFSIYRSTSTEPELITDPGCERIGSLSVPIPAKSDCEDRSVETSFLFGGTEIIVNVKVTATGESFETSVDFLD